MQDLLKKGVLFFMYPAFETQIGAFVASHTPSEGNSTELFLNHEAQRH